MDEQFQTQLDAAAKFEEHFVPALFDQWSDAVTEAARVDTGLRVLDVADPLRPREVGRYVNAGMKQKQQAYNNLVIDGTTAPTSGGRCRPAASSRTERPGTTVRSCCATARSIRWSPAIAS